MLFKPNQTKLCALGLFVSLALPTMCFAGGGITRDEIAALLPDLPQYREASKEREISAILAPLTSSLDVGGISRVFSNDLTHIIKLAVHFNDLPFDSRAWYLHQLEQSIRRANPIYAPLKDFLLEHYPNVHIEQEVAGYKKVQKTVADFFSPEAVSKRERERERAREASGARQ